MLRQRLIVALILIPIGMWVVAQGGWIFNLFIALILGLAVWEYGQLFRAGGFQPAVYLAVGGVLLLAVGRAWGAFDGAPWMVSLILLLSMTYHLIAFERGRDQAGTDFAITISGVFYVGWLGAYLISLRNLPDGLWWFMLVMPAVWLADSGAFFIGRRFGRRRLSPRLSPKKTWEGYLGGILVATLGTALLGALWRFGAGPGSLITPARGALLGVILAAVTPLGDLGESMLKRQVGVKDSSNLLPGHGGVLDRIDSWLWAGVLGYYLVLWLFL